MNNSPVFSGAEACPPSAAGLQVLELGNADLMDSCTWVPRDVQPGTTPLPIYPLPGDLQA